MAKQPPEISIVVPLLNEQDNIRPLYEQITQALQGKHGYEIIFVDDGSTDESVNTLKELQKTDSRLRIIRFRRNFGQTAALSAGFDHAHGAIIVALDADLQNDPADIPAMIEKLHEGYDVVSGWRKKRHDKALTRRIPSMCTTGSLQKSRASSSTTSAAHSRHTAARCFPRSGSTAKCTASYPHWQAGAALESVKWSLIIDPEQPAEQSTAWGEHGKSCLT